jgi:hypothetical protein
LRDDDVFCLEHARTLSRDFVVQFGTRGLQLDRGARGRVPAGAKVIVRETQSRELRVIHVSRLHGERECRWTPAAPRATKPHRPEAPMTPKLLKEPNRPAADHPWRRRIIPSTTPSSAAA